MRILLVSGSLRSGSTNTAVLRTLQALAPAGTDAVLYEGTGRLPHFNPDDDHEALHPEVAALRDAVRAADAMVISTPEYAGALPGSLKNLLEWCIGDADPRSIYEKPVAWLNASTGPTEAAEAHRSLGVVLGYAHARVVDSACALVPVTRSMVATDSTIDDGTVRSQLLGVLQQLAAVVAASPDEQP